MSLNVIEPFRSPTISYGYLGYRIYCTSSRCHSEVYRFLIEEEYDPLRFLKFINYFELPKHLQPRPVNLQINVLKALYVQRASC